jgi:hypothetical protein
MWPVTGQELYFPGFVEGKLGKTDHLKDLGVDGRIMLKIP